MPCRVHHHAANASDVAVVGTNRPERLPIDRLLVGVLQGRARGDSRFGYDECLFARSGERGLFGELRLIEIAWKAKYLRVTGRRDDLALVRMIGQNFDDALLATERRMRPRRVAEGVPASYGKHFDFGGHRDVVGFIVERVSHVVARR